MKAVLDTNIVASASFWGGKPLACLEAWTNGRFAAVVSPQVLAEYAEVFERLRETRPGQPCVAWHEKLAIAAELVFPAVRFRGACADPDDEVFLECAVAGGAGFIVTGDGKHLLKLKEWQGVQLVTCADFLARLP